MPKKSISEIILEASPEERGKLRIEKGRVRRRKVPEKVMHFTRDELITYLKVNNIKSLSQLRKKRVPNKDPNFCHYRVEFKKWSEALRIAFPSEFAIQEKPPDTADYILKVMLQFKAFSVLDFKALRRKMPDIVPSYWAIIRAFGSFKLALYTVQRHSLKEMAERYLSLKQKLGKIPTFEECKEQDIDLTRLLRVFKKKSSLDEFMDKFDIPANKLKVDKKNAKRTRSSSKTGTSI